MLLGERIALLFQSRFLNLMLNDAPLDHVQLGGHGIDFGADGGTCLVDKVDGLVRQKPVGDVPVGKGSGGDNGAICNFHAVVHLIALLQAAQNGNGILHVRLVHHYRLEPALQRRVFFDVLAVFIQRGGTDAVQLAPGQHGL